MYLLIIYCISGEIKVYQGHKESIRLFLDNNEDLLKGYDYYEVFKLQAEVTDEFPLEVK